MTRSGLTSEDPEGEALRRQSLILMAVAIVALSVGWVTAYALLGLYVSALIPFGYQVITTAGLILLARGWRFEAFRTMQLGLMLALPVLLQWSLGGFRSSSGVLLSLTAPLGALVFTNRPAPWFLGYLGLTAVSGRLDPFLTPAPIPQAVNLTFFVLNVGAVSGVVYYLLRYFIRGLMAEREMGRSSVPEVEDSRAQPRITCTWWVRPSSTSSSSEPGGTVAPSMVKPATPLLTPSGLLTSIS